MNFKRICSLMLIVTVGLSVADAQEKPTEAPASPTQEKPKEKGNENIRLLNAKNKFLERDYKLALDLYKELLAEHKSDPIFNLRVGQCFLELNKGDEALTYLEKAKELKADVDEDIDFYLGRAYHKTSQIDKAIASLNAFKGKISPKRAKSLELDWFLEQCNTAKIFMEKPADVVITNLGPDINSKFDDYAPSISADGKTMIFTSRRDDTKGGGIDWESDKKFFEDIYMSTWDEKKGGWDQAHAIKGSLNTEGHDASLSIAPDGKKIFVYRNITDETRSGDIYVSKMNNSGKWGAPHSLGEPINSSYFESSASITVDGNTLFFVSERKGGQGNSDIWMVTKKTKQLWNEPVNMGPVINTIEDEVSVFIHPDGKTLFFSSKGHNSMGGYDIFKTVLDDKGNWSKPENVGFPINTVNDDLHFSLSTDLSTAYYSSYIPNKGQGERDIYKIDMSKYFKHETGKGPELSILQGKITDATTGVETESDIIVLDESGKECATTHAVDGTYFFTLPSGKTYTLSIRKDGYKDISEKISLALDKAKGTSSTVKDFSLEKK